ncbi:MAG: dTDP-glucose 4,6-dehydratase [Sedimentisphaerales bacterium]|nr:dTDP-glucose 4,6-dehydratase [Sedimentisphaerales bacterium]
MSPSTKNKNNTKPEKRILVTGAAGFIGSNFVHLLLNEKPNWHIVALDSLTYAGNLANLTDCLENQNVEFIKGDICDPQTVTQALANVDIVVNFAAESHVDRSILGCQDFIRTNVTGTQVLLDAARAANVKRFIQISTDEVYGSLGPEGYFTETSPLAPNSPYSASKAAADLLCRAYFKTYQFPVIVTRCSNNYGPYQFPEKLIPLFVTNLIENKKVPVYGDGLQVRDWIHVNDHCTAILAVIEKGAPGEIYNVGGNNDRPNLELVKMILEYLDKSESSIEYVTDRPGHDRRYAVDCSKIERELRWEPNIDFAEGLTRTIDWYKENPQWWQQIKTGQYLKYYQQQYGVTI